MLGDGGGRRPNDDAERIDRGKNTATYLWLALLYLGGQVDGLSLLAPSPQASHEDKNKTRREGCSCLLTAAFKKQKEQKRKDQYERDGKLIVDRVLLIIR